MPNHPSVILLTAFGLAPEDMSKNDRTRVEVHIIGCKECYEQVGSLQTNKDWLNQLPAEE